MKRACQFIILYICITINAYAIPSIVIEEGDQIQNILPHIDKKSLIIFDIDNTIMRSKTSLGSSQWYYHMITLERNNGATREEAITKVYPTAVKVHHSAQVEAMDPCIPGLIRTLQEEGYTVMALTSRKSYVAQRTLEQLNSIGIDFSHAFDTLECTFDCDRPVVFYEGVLFATDYFEKGLIMDQFLNQVDPTREKFNKIVFVDDSMKHVDNLKTCAERRNLHYFGLRYSKEDKHAEDYDHSIATKQYECLMKGLDDDTAKRLLQYPEGREVFKDYRHPVAHSERIDHTLAEQNTSPFLPEGDVPITMIESTAIRDVLRYADEKTLVLFDINDTLTTTKHFLGGGCVECTDAQGAKS